MTGTRRRPRGHEQVTVTLNGGSPTLKIPAAPVPGQAHEATEVIEGVTPSLAQDLAEGLRAAELGLTDDLASYVREPVPDLYSADPADRTEWFLLAGGPEPLFEATVADLGAEWLVHTSLPVPPRTAPETTEDTKDPVPGATPTGARPAPAVPGTVITKDSGSGSAPPVDEAAAETSAPASAGPEPVSTEDGEPDEPVAEPDCGEGSEA